jgi:hypothetical protein
MATQTKKTNKGAAIATYVIALVCLLAGIFAPLYGTSGSITERMLFLRLPGAINSALGKTVLSVSWAKPFTELYRTQIFGASVNIYAWTTLLYAAITVVGIFFLIPVIAGKKTKHTSATCAYIIETATVLVLSVYIIFKMSETTLAGWSNLGILLAFAGSLIILILQAFINKKNLGLTKFFLLLLSSIAILALYDITLWITALATPITNLANAISSEVAFCQGSSGIYYFVNNILNIQNIGSTLGGLDMSNKVLYLAITLTVALVMINYFVDLIGIASSSKRDSKNHLKKNSGSKVFGLIRYALELIAAFITIIMLLIVKGKIGVYLYLVLIIALIEFIYAIARLYHNKYISRCNQADERIQINDDDITSEQPAEEIDVVYAEEKKEESVSPAPAPVEEETKEEPKQDEVEAVEEHEEEQMTIDVQPEPAPAEEVVEEPVSEEKNVQPEEQPAPVVVPEADTVTEKTHTIVYNVKTVYNGPTDEFIETLTDSEKIEFAKVFIEKSKATLPNIPDYEIGGNNSEFFHAIFIYLAKFRNILSSNLLSKIYKYLNSMN